MMLKVFYLMAAALVVTNALSFGNRPPKPTKECQKWCPRPGQFGQYDCCDNQNELCADNWPGFCIDGLKRFPNGTQIGVGGCNCAEIKATGWCDVQGTEYCRKTCGYCGDTPCSTLCTANYDPVCGSDGKTYSNACALSVASCQNPTDFIATAYDGECAPAACSTLCTANYDPVCGSDGKTYSNACTLSVASCQNPTDFIATAYDGECATACSTLCTANYDPVCGSDGKTYSNACALSVASCQNPTDFIATAYDGECAPEIPIASCPSICPANYEPVCGSDGITYSNACALAIASCQNPSGNIATVYDGECDPSGNRAPNTPNCQGRRKRRPECQNQNKPINCNTRRNRRKPQCQRETGTNEGVTV